MRLDIVTLVFMTSIVFMTQTVAVFIQYKVNRTYHGLRWWLQGAIFEAVGFMLMAVFTVRSIWMLAIFANPCVVLGLLFLNTGIVKFLGRKERRWIPVLLYAAYIVLYAYFLFVDNSIQGRTISVYAVTAIISMKIAYTLFREKKRQFSASANFSASVFLAYSLIQTMTIVAMVNMPPIQAYSDISLAPIRTLAFIVPTVCSILWTFGFIVMVNQRLNAENIEEKDKLAMVFDTNPDAQVITRLGDGLIVDVNSGFLSMTGHARDEIIGQTIGDINLWPNARDRQSYVAELAGKKKVDNREFPFMRKNGNLFIGSISGRLILVDETNHIVSVLQDITERKVAEQKIQELVEQLEIERNTAQRNAVTDSLTGLMNRRYFDEIIKTEFRRQKRSCALLSLIILDIDHFKKFNDTYGHPAGDDCLRRVGSVLTGVVKRLSDVVARYGGEEFVVIMPETDRQGAVALAEQIREGVEDLAIPHSTSGVAPCVTVSIGVVTVKDGDLSDSVQLVELADKALYEAKHGGRNSIRVAEP